MKIDAELSLCYSAYPLKALNLDRPAKTTPGHSPFLRAILSGKTRTTSRVRVLPMVNPYKGTPIPPVKRKERPAGDAEHKEKDWFNNYE